MATASEQSRFASIFAAGTLLSRVLGLVRDQVWAFFMPKASLDAFLIAFKFPNMLREIVGEGASNAAFVPIFTESHAKESNEEFQRLVSAVLSAMIILLAVLTIAGIIFLPALLQSLGALDAVTGQEAPSAERISQIISISQWTFPYLFFICLAVFLMAPLFTLKHYSTPSWSPALLNVAFIGSCLIFRNSFDEPAYALVLGAWIGGIAQLAVQYAAVVRISGVRYPNFQLMHPGIRRVFYLIIPVLIGQSAGEVNRLVDTLFAASLPEAGTVTSLFYANRLIQLPLSIFAVATSVAMLPTLSRLHATKKHNEMTETIQQGMRHSFFFIMPAIIGLFLLGEPIIALLFERGEFTPADTARTATALSYYVFGLLAFAWVKVVVTGFYGAQDTRTPVLIASGAMLLNIALNIALIGPLGFKGLALSTTISYSINCFGLIAILNTRNPGLIDKELIEGVLRILGAALFMGVVTLGVYRFSVSWWPEPTLLHRTGVVLIPIAASCLAYGIFAKGFQVKEYDHFLEGLRNRTKR
ncbi:MAG: murein biosynthesis integral membrane protein MurJ [Candidatus Hydrogenedentota bacterium]